jgi:hypothetical protein
MTKRELLTLRLSAKITDRVGLNATIPWFNVFLLVPLLNGLVLVILSKNPIWGWIACSQHSKRFSVSSSRITWYFTTE